MKKLYYIVLISLGLACISCIREDTTPVEIPPIQGALVDPEVGGPAQPNQVWIDLSDNKITQNRRDEWDLGFYCGNEFRVILNSSLQMAVAKIEGHFNIDEVNSTTVASMKPVVKVGTYQDNVQYIDSPSGNYLTQTTGMEAISENDAENAVYLLNLGSGIYTGTVSPGRIYYSGAERGWKKIRVLRKQNQYLIQFADLDSTTHEEVIIDKDEKYNFKFLNLEQKSLVNIQPEKNKWDLCFSVFTNAVSAGSYYTAYTFGDMVLNNILGNVSAYEVSAGMGQGETAYNAFQRSDVDFSKFVTNDQRAIGSNWRTALGANGPEVYTDRFYVLKDSEGFLFKIRFIKMLNNDGYRGYPQFEYQPL